MRKFSPARLADKALLLWVPLLALLTFVILPFVWGLITSLKREQDVVSENITWLPHPATFDNYVTVWNQSKFSVYFSNSLLVSATSVVFVLILSLFNAYALSRFRFRGRQAVLVTLLATQMMPVILCIIPLFVVFKNLGLINSPGALILFYTAAQVPFNSLLMQGFVGSIPVTLDEAAMVDGASRMRILFTVVAPVVLPGIVATSAFAFIGCWNEFLVAFSFITQARWYTIPIGLKSMIGEYSVSYASLAAGSIIGLIPPVLLFAYIQRFLVEGLGSGAVKG